jgi:cytochrome c peroxidase
MRSSWIALLVLASWTAAPVRAAEYRWQLPAGFPQPVVPTDNPMSEVKVALGRGLFADPRLSVTGTHSCQSCHDPARAFTDGQVRSRGVLGDELPLNAPSLVNAVYNPSQGWRDPHIRTLEQQMRGPLFNEHPAELGIKGRESLIEAELAADPAMATAFSMAFPSESRPVTLSNVIRAIAAFERTLIRGGSAFDRHVFEGSHQSMDDSQNRGMELFFSRRAGCAACHGGINFSGSWIDRQHPDAEPAFADNGSGVALRVPTLRNLAVTGPYLHDGRAASMDAVLDHYERTAANPAADPRLRRAPLTTEERGALRDFLRALDSY